MVASDAQSEDGEGEEIAPGVGAAEYTSQVVVSILGTGHDVPKDGVECNGQRTQLKGLLGEIHKVCESSHGV